MSPGNAINSLSDFPRKNLEWILVILSSTLLGIWAVKDTIALRNILLVGGALFAIYYIVQEWRYHDLKKYCSTWKILPIILVGLTFIWVITHYFIYSLDPITQLDELKSTWLRAFLATIIGLGTGLSLRNYPNRLNLLWLGIFISFMVLFYQYIPRAIAQDKLLVPDYDHYLFHLKINTVLMGTILLAGIDGALWDHLRSINYRWNSVSFRYLLFWLIGTVMVLWSFVYIVDSRNGIGLSTILYSFWFICASVLLTKGQIKQPNLKGLVYFIFAISILLIVLYFAYLQTKVNKGWLTLFEDAKIAVQIDKYPNWHNLPQLGYPERADGQPVTANTYERVAWATAGIVAITSYPVGVGVLSRPLTMHPNVSARWTAGSTSSNVLNIATHSGWVELGLALGVPVLIFIFSSLIITFINALTWVYSAKMTILGFVILIATLYTVGEAAIDHGLEILFYLLAFLPALLLTESKIANPYSG